MATPGPTSTRGSGGWPTTTRHLRVLREAGLVSVEKKGRERIYRLNRERLLGVTGEWLAWFRDDG